jgi:hypothetical protein
MWGEYYSGKGSPGHVVYSRLEIMKKAKDIKEAFRLRKMPAAFFLNQLNLNPLTNQHQSVS